MAETKEPSKRGRTSYSFAKQQARRDKRRQEAEARQRDYDGLTLKQKLQRAQTRGGSKREIARIEAAIKAAKEKKVEPQFVPAADLKVKAVSPKIPEAITIAEGVRAATEPRPRSKYKAKKEKAVAS